jgi:hypothetical protein
VFYIRHLLLYHPARSWELLRTINLILYKTFQDAAIAAGLFVTENEGELAMVEAVKGLATPYQLRVLFSHILLNGCCETPRPVWDRFTDQMSDDFYYRAAEEDREQAVDLCLQSLADYLDEGGKRLSDYGLPEPRSFSRIIDQEVELYGSNRIELANECDAAYERMNAGQRTIFNVVTRAVENDESGPFFIAGGAGRGKTFLVEALCAWVRSRGRIAIPTATSGCAATLYKGGRTTHSAFKVSFGELP